MKVRAKVRVRIVVIMVSVRISLQEINVNQCNEILLCGCDEVSPRLYL